MEKRTVGDLVNIDTLMQNFISAKVREHKLILSTNNTELEFAIKQDASMLIQKSIEVLQKPKKSLLEKDEHIFTLSEIKGLSAYNKDEQIKIKEEIDKLVFELYELTEEEIKIVENKLDS